MVHIIFQNTRLIEISSRDHYNDYFRLELSPTSDGDNEYVKDYHIDSIRTIDWHKIMNEIADKVNDIYDLVYDLDEMTQYSTLFDLDVSCGRYDCSIQNVFVTEYYINEINKIIKKHLK